MSTRIVVYRENTGKGYSGTQGASFVVAVGLVCTVFGMLGREIWQSWNNKRKSI